MSASIPPHVATQPNGAHELIQTETNLVMCANTDDAQNQEAWPLSANRTLHKTPITCALTHQTWRPLHIPDCTRHNGVFLSKKHHFILTDKGISHFISQWGGWCMYVKVVLDNDWGFKTPSTVYLIEVLFSLKRHEHIKYRDKCCI